MTVRILYDIEYYRTIPAVMIDARGGTPLNNQTGFVIKSYTDSEVSKASASDVLTYKIETDLGNLIGYLTLQVRGASVSVYQYLTRPAFAVSQPQIMSAIINFVSTNSWEYA